MTVAIDGATSVVVVLAIHAGREDMPRLFSTMDRAQAWADAQPDEVTCVIWESAIDDPDEQHRKRSDLS